MVSLPAMSIDLEAHFSFLKYNVSKSHIRKYCTGHTRYSVLTYEWEIIRAYNYVCHKPDHRQVSGSSALNKWWNRQDYHKTLIGNETHNRIAPFLVTLSDLQPYYGRPIGQAVKICSCGFFFISSSFFLAYFRRSQVECLPYFHTWCGLSANLECMSEMCCTRLAENTGRKKRQKFAICAPSHNFATAAFINNHKKIVKQQYLLRMSSQCGELRPTNGWDRLAGLGHPGNFNGFRVLTSLLQRRTEVNQTFHDVWTSPGLVHYIYVFGVSCPVTEFCQVHSSVCVHVLRSPILAALVLGTRAVGVSQTAALSRGRHLYSSGRPSCWASAHILGSPIANPYNTTTGTILSGYCR